MALALLFAKQSGGPDTTWAVSASFSSAPEQSWHVAAKFARVPEQSWHVAAKFARVPEQSWHVAASFFGSHIHDISFTAAATFALTVPLTPVLVPVDTSRRVEYDVWLMDTSGRPLAFIKNKSWSQLDYTRTTNEVGTLSLTLNDTFDWTLIQSGRTIEVWRRVGNHPSVLDTDTIWFIRKTEITLTDQGLRTLKVTCVSANDILARRIVAYQSNSAYTQLTGYVDDIMKTIAAQNMSSAALDTTRAISSGRFVVDGFLSQGSVTTKEYAKRVLMDIFKELAQTSYESGKPLYFDIVGNPNSSSLRFATYYQQRGADRRHFSAHPVLITVGNHAIKSYTLTDDHTSEFNVAYVGGDGEEATRPIGYYEDTGRSRINAFARFESWQDGRGTADITALNDFAKSAVQSSRPKFVLDADLTNIGAIYGRDWNFGDYVSVDVEKRLFDCRVASVHVTMQDNGDDKIEAKLRSDQ
jgi:hypothetical protein